MDAREEYEALEFEQNTFNVNSNEPTTPNKNVSPQLNPESMMDNFQSGSYKMDKKYSSRMMQIF